MQVLARHWHHGEGGQEFNPRLAMLYYRACSQAAFWGCHIELGKLYRDGTWEKYGVRRNTSKAFYHLYMAMFLDYRDGTGPTVAVFRDFYKTLTPEERNIAKAEACMMVGIKSYSKKLCERVFHKEIKNALALP
jgi:TPR repeat protein